MKISKNIRKWIKYGVTAVYVILMLYFLFFAEQFGRTTAVSGYRYNLVPFREIRRFLIYYHQLGVMTVMVNVLGNVVVFVPLGILLPAICSGKAKRMRLPFVVIIAAVSFIVELIQLVAKVGTFDVDDIILNTVGGILGVVIFSLSNAVYERKIQRNEDI